MATDTKLQELVINTMTKAQYDALETKDPNEIYVATDAKTGAQDLDTSNVGTTGQVLSKTDTGMEWKTVSGGGGDYLPLAGGAMTGPFIAPKHTDYNFDYATVLQLRTDTNSATGTPFDIQITSIGNAIRFMGGIITTRGVNPDIDGTLTLGSSYLLWKNIFVKKINNGADISVPTTGGTMVVATPPTTAGNYVLKATVAEDGTITTQWVAES